MPIQNLDSLANIKARFSKKNSLILTVIACSLSRSRVSSSIMLLTQKEREREINNPFSLTTLRQCLSKTKNRLVTSCDWHMWVGMREVLVRGDLMVGVKAGGKEGRVVGGSFTHYLSAWGMNDHIQRWKMYRLCVCVCVSVVAIHDVL